MGLFAGLAGLFGCAPEPLPDQAQWEASVLAAAVSVPALHGAGAAFEVTGGLSEMRTMVVSGDVEATSTTQLRPVAEAVERAVAPAVVGLPVKGAALRIVLRGSAVAGSPTPTSSTTIRLDDLAKKHDLTRGPR